MKRFIVSAERALRGFLVYPLFRLLFRNQHVAVPYDLSRVHSILILRYDKIGDMIVTLPVFRILRERNRQLRIDVVASEANAVVLRNERNVNSVFVLYRNPVKLLREFYRIRRSRPDVVLNFIFNRITSGGLIANLLCPNALKVGQGPEKYGFYFNVLLSLPRGSIHMLDMLVMYVEQVFGLAVADDEKRLQFPVDSSAAAKVKLFLENHGLSGRFEENEKRSRFVVFNTSAGQKNNRLSIKQATSIAAFLGNEMCVKAVVISAPEDRNRARRIVSEAKTACCTYFPETEDSSLSEVASLLGAAASVITPNTAIVHLASAMATPVLGIFTPLQVNQEWMPYGVRYELVSAPSGQPTSAIPSKHLLDGIRRFLETVPGLRPVNNPQQRNV